MCPCSEDSFPCPPITKNDLKRRIDKAVIQRINKLKVYCTFNRFGCNQIIPLSALEKHTAVCDHGVRCGFCEELMQKNTLDEHHNNACSKFTVECEYQCGASIIRQDLSFHRCHLKPVKCKYYSYGCDVKMTETDMPSHENDTDSHLLTIAKSCARDIATLQGKLENALHENTQLIAQLTTRSNNDMMSMNESLMKKIHDVDAKVSRIIGGTEYNVVTGIREQVINHDRTLSELQTRMDNLDLRLTCAESVDLNGVLIWRIDNYSKRRKQAIDGMIISLYSQPFYTSRYGYKMCARLYLNGDGVGRSKYLSLFFVVLRGEYDELNQWPFVFKVHLSLLDQVNNRRHITDAFKPDPTSTSFQKPKPTSPLNIPFGCPLFVPLPTLESPDEPYLRNDEIYIKIVVDVPVTHVR